MKIQGVFNRRNYLETNSGQSMHKKNSDYIG